MITRQQADNPENTEYHDSQCRVWKRIGPVRHSIRYTDSFGSFQFAVKSSWNSYGKINQANQVLFHIPSECPGNGPSE